ncbi:MAG: OmpA family protein [Gammaproteobacteria bacterium]|nr:OmpA family protein [Gammaproteobacteria bacterium]
MNYAGKTLTLLLAVSLFGCAADDPNRRAKTGAAVGAVVGAVLGHQLDDDSGRYVGAVAGAIAGGAVGHYMDNQQNEFEAALADERYAHDVEIERLQDESLKINVSNEVSFDFDRAEIKPGFRPTLDKVADILTRYDRSVVHVIGHTDSTGSDAYNQDLSERRARSVVNYLASRGVSESRLQTEGRGEREPRDTNATEAGRQLNRRVELFIKPVVAGQEQDAYQAP